MAMNSIENSTTAKLLANEVSGGLGAAEKKTGLGLTTAEAERGLEEFGYNEIPLPVVPLWKLFLLQFTGTMPYMLEIACILSLVVDDVIDFGIIVTMLVCNAYLGFHEELKAKESLEELTSKMEQRIATLRDGKATQLVTRMLVPGDVVLLVGGCAVPADVRWLSGDVLSVDTAALTGEPIPRKYPSDTYGDLILSGCTVRAGEAYGCVVATGARTVAGEGNADIMADKTKSKVSVFESRILLAVKVIIMASLVDVIAVLLVQGLGRNEFDSNVNELILTCLSIIIAAVPIALPLVLQVTMALGAGKMARDYNAVVTSLPALQDIASMTVLCSDKTGTLTTAEMTVRGQKIWVNDRFTPAQLALYGALSSNRDKKEDPIDRAVINHFDSLPADSAEVTSYFSNSEYKRERLVGFNPIYKRVIAEYTHTDKSGRARTLLIAKGLPVKVLNTADGGVDDADDQFKVKNYDELYDVVNTEDQALGKAGYKTLGVSVKIGDMPWEFVGLLPLSDPPRKDTISTVVNLQRAGVEVKMITGDHLNIAIETARQINMGLNIRPGHETRGGEETTKELIKDANGFAQVLPKDKRECVLTLKNHYNMVVGMTGDGVNDAPALSAAQCGIAVDDATDAAKNAAAIILTSPGLSAIYTGVVESRRIFRKLKAYVTYRFAATIQIVVVLSVLIFVSDCAINSLFIILLALFNDLTMLPIAYDTQQASRRPEHSSVTSMLVLSGVLGLLESIASFAFVYGGAELMGVRMDLDKWDTASQANIWLQISIAAELLIFSARAPSLMFTSIAPSIPLTVSVLLGCVITSLLAGCFDYFGSVSGHDIVIIWAFDVVTLLIIDGCKVAFLNFMGQEEAVIPEQEIEAAAKGEVWTPPSSSVHRGSRLRDTHTSTSHISRHSNATSEADVDVLMAAHARQGTATGGPRHGRSMRLDGASARLSEWADRHADKADLQASYKRAYDEGQSARVRVDSAADSSIASWRSGGSMSSIRLSGSSSVANVVGAVVSVPGGSGAISGRPRLIDGGNLRPAFPPSSSSRR